MNWDYNNDGSQTAVYRGVTIEARVDTCPPEPFDSWSRVAIVTYSGDGLAHYGNTDRPQSVADCVRLLTARQLIRHQKRILAAFESPAFDHMPADYLAKDMADAWRESRRDGWSRTDFLWDYFGNRLPDDVSARDILPTMESLLNISGVPCYRGASSGFCQGDWADILVIGESGDSESMLESCADTWGDWAWGNCYYGVIDELEESCCGFYGDPDESGLESWAIDTIDSAYRDWTRRKADMVKRMVRNRVPLGLRPAMLAGVRVYG